MFCQQDHSKDLCPLGDDVADDLSPLRGRFADGKEPDPCHAGDCEKDGERVVLQETE